MRLHLDLAASPGHTTTPPPEPHDHTATTAAAAASSLQACLSGEASRPSAVLSTALSSRCSLPNFTRRSGDILLVSARSARRCPPVRLLPSSPFIGARHDAGVAAVSSVMSVGRPSLLSALRVWIRCGGSSFSCVRMCPAFRCASQLPSYFHLLTYNYFP
jgi:hypothetical protein